MIITYCSQERNANETLARASTANKTFTPGLEIIEIPCDGNCFQRAARFALLQLHDWNYDLFPIQHAMREEVCFVLRGKRCISDMKGFNRDSLKDPWRDLRSIPVDMVALVLPRLTFYDLWDHWVDEMEGLSAFTVQLFAHGLSAIRRICDRMPEP